MKKPRKSRSKFLPYAPVDYVRPYRFPVHTPFEVGWEGGGGQEGGSPVPLTMPADIDPEPPDPEMEIRRDTIRRFLEIVAGGGIDALSLGRQMMLLAWCVEATRFKSNRDAARRLKLSDGRVSQILKELELKFSGLLGENVKRSGARLDFHRRQTPRTLKVPDRL